MPAACVSHHAPRERRPRPEEQVHHAAGDGADADEEGDDLVDDLGTVYRKHLNSSYMWILALMPHLTTLRESSESQIELQEGRLHILQVQPRIDAFISGQLNPPMREGPYPLVCLIHI